MTKRKYFNVTLTRDMIAQAYHNNISYNAHCFLLGPSHGTDLPEGFIINEAKLVDGHLNVKYTNASGYDIDFYIENGNLKARFMEKAEVVALVDLGNVIGPQGPQGETGATGPQGEAGPTGSQGPQGEAGITPTFVLGDGTGGTVEGHLYADYDNPYTPT